MKTLINNTQSLQDKKVLFKNLKKSCDDNKISGLTIVFNSSDEELQSGDYDVSGYIVNDEVLSCYYFDEKPIYITKNTLIQINNSFILYPEVTKQIDKISEGKLNIFIYYLCLWKGLKIKDENI